MLALRQSESIHYEESESIHPDEGLCSDEGLTLEMSVFESFTSGLHAEEKQAIIETSLHLLE